MRTTCLDRLTVLRYRCVRYQEDLSVQAEIDSHIPLFQQPVSNVLRERGLPQFHTDHLGIHVSSVWLVWKDGEFDHESRTVKRRGHIYALVEGARKRTAEWLPCFAVFRIERAVLDPKAWRLVCWEYTVTNMLPRLAYPGFAITFVKSGADEQQEHVA